MTRNVGSGATVNFSNVVATPLDAVVTTTGLALGNASNKIIFTSAPTLIGTAQTGGTGLLPYATVNGSELATYTAASGLLTYTGTGIAYVQNSFATAGANVNLTTAGGTPTVASSVAINSLTVSANTTLTISTGVTLTITSGAIYDTAGSSLTIAGGGTLAFGATDGVIQTGSTASAITLNSSMSGSGGLTFAGSGTVTLASNDPNLSGTTTLDGGILTLGNSGAALPSNYGTITGATLATPIVITTASTTGLQTGQTVTISGVLGNTAANGIWTITVLTATTFQLNNSAGNFAYTSGGTWSNNPLNLIGGTLQASTSVVLSNAVSLNNSNVTIGGTSPIVFAGTVSLAGFNNTLSVTNTAPTAVTGIIEDNNVNAALALTKMGGGTLTLTGTNTFSDQVNILGGIVNIQNSSALGSNSSQPSLDFTTNASITTASGALVGNGATLQLQGGVTVSKTLALNGGTLESLTGTNVYAGPINLNFASAANPNTILVDVGPLAVYGQISGTTDLNKTGGGTLILDSANSFTGQLNINAGIVTLGSIITFAGGGPAAFGAVTGSIVVSSGATLQLNPSAATTYAGKQLFLNGTGLGLTLSTLLEGTGALESATSTSTANTWAGSIILSSNTTINSIQNTLTLTGAISGAGNLTKVGAGTIFIAGPDTHTGATAVTVGTLTVNGVGQILNTSGVTVNPMPRSPWTTPSSGQFHGRHQPDGPLAIRVRCREPHPEQRHLQLPGQQHAEREFVG